MKINKSLSSEPRQCKAKLNLSIKPAEIPTLITLDKLTEIQKGDDNPYEIVEEILDIDEPVKGVVFTREFWKSYLEKLNDAPFPGSKSGHTIDWWKTGDMDFYTIGGEIKENSVFLKMYIPTQGYKSSNETFIKATKAGMVHFSITSWTEDIIEMDENGEVVSIKAIRSVKGERNDAAERDMGAMPQKVNKDNTGKTPDKKQEVYIMPEAEYNEIIKNLKNRCANGGISVNKICNDLGFEIVTSAHKDKIKAYDEVVSLTGENPVEVIKEMKANAQSVKQEAYENMRSRLMRDEFGELGTDEKPNLKRQAAEPLVSKKIQDEKTLKAEIEKAKENPVVMNISFQQADFNSNINNLSGVSVKKENEARTSEHVEV